jgi:hypothetical protein
VDDPTNAPNPWQGALRTAPLDMDLLVERISQDAVGILSLHRDARLNLLLTCVDQAGPDWRCKVKDSSPPESARQLGFLQGRIMAAVQAGLLMQRINTTGHRLLVSDGPTRSHVSVVSVETRSMLDIMLKVAPPELAAKLRERLA